MPIVFHATPDPNIIRQFFDIARPTMAIGDYETEYAERQNFAVVIRQEGKIIGGAVAAIQFDWCYVETVWVDGTIRGQGLGGKVMQALETYALRQGAHGVYLYTTEYQATPFYSKVGYTILGILPDHPPGYITTYFAKMDLQDHPFANDTIIEQPATNATADYLGMSLVAESNHIVEIVSHHRVFLHIEKGQTIGGIFGLEFWGWFNVHLCYSPNVGGIALLLDHLDEYALHNKLGIYTQVYRDTDHELLQDRGFTSMASLPDRPNGKTTSLMMKPSR